MAFFQAKRGWERPRKSENKNYRFDHFLPDPKQQNPKKIENKFKKLKNTIKVSFRANLGWERPRKCENKNYRSDQFLSEPQQRIEKKIAKKFKKQKNTKIASFQSKTGWERPRKSDNKNYRSNHFLPDLLQRIPKNSKKRKKKILLWLLFKEKQVGKGRERVKIKIFVPSISYPIVIENSKNIAKKFKKLENTIMASFQAKTGWERPR